MSKTRKALLVLLALAVLKRPVDMLLAAMLPDSAVNPVPPCIAGMVAAVLMMGLPAWLLHPWTSPRLTQQKMVWPGGVMGAGAALLTRAAMTPADAAWQAALSLTPDAMPVPENVPLAMLYVVALVIVPALAEESFFRGALLTGLLDGARRVTAAALTVLSFVLLHGSMANLPSLLVLSLLLTLLMLRTGRIAVPMAAHLVYNLTALGWMDIPLWVSLLCGAGLIGLSVRLITGQPRVAHPPMKLPDALIVALTLAVLILAAVL